MKKFIFLFSIYTNLYSISPEEAVQTVLNILSSVETLKADIILNDSLNGILYYKAPKQIHIKLSDGRIIASNGRFLWFYSPYNYIVGKQQLEEESNYSLKYYFLKYKEIQTVEDNQFKLSLDSKDYKEIIFSIDENRKFLRLLIFKKSNNADKQNKITFSNIKLNLGLTTNLFNFNPSAEAQVVINPLNY